MSKTWLYADPHFYHKNIVTFLRGDGTKLRPWDDAEQMTEDMIKWYNELVSTEDRVYILGDVAFSAAHMRASVSRLNGRKVLVPGNHEPPKMRKYFDLFDDVRGYVVKKGFIMSHIPIHPGSLSRWTRNFHGHLHANRVTEVGYGEDYRERYDPRYVCVSVEHTNFRPIDLDELLVREGLR